MTNKKLSPAEIADIAFARAKAASRISDETLADISSAFSIFEQIGIAYDGTAIRNVIWYDIRTNCVIRLGPCVREPSGYFCTPIAYSCRINSGGREYLTPKWTKLVAS